MCLAPFSHVFIKLLWIFFPPLNSFFFPNGAPQEVAVRVNVNVSEPAVSGYLWDFSAKGQRDASRGITPEKRETGGVRGCEKDDPRWERRDGASVRARLDAKMLAPLQRFSSRFCL